MKSATKSSSLESKQYLDNHKESTKLELHDIRDNKTISDKQKKALTSLLYDEVREKQGTEDFKKHMEVRKADYKKIRELVIERVGDSKKVKKEDIQDAVDFFYGKSERQESKEIATKSLEFEKDTFKISNDGFEEVTAKTAKNNPALQKFLDKGIKVKANTAWDVVEYMEDKVNWDLVCKKGEQIFITYDAFIREVCKAKNCSKEVAESKYLMTIEEFQEKMKDKPDNSEEYKKFFNEEVNGRLAGYWDPDNKEFCDVSGRSGIWLVGGDSAGFDQDEWDCSDSGRDYGFSGRLLKN